MWVTCKYELELYGRNSKKKMRRYVGYFRKMWVEDVFVVSQIQHVGLRHGRR